MTFCEFAQKEYAAGRIPVVTVWHPEMGMWEVPAFSAMDAKVQALAFWGLDYAELSRLRVYRRSASAQCGSAPGAE